MARELYFHFPGLPLLHKLSIKISCNFRHLFFLSQNPFFVTILALLGAEGIRFILFIKKMAPKFGQLLSLLISFFILSPTVRPKTSKIIQNHIFIDLGWILNPFEMDFDRF